ncbi:MAG: hypothetical protein N3A66_06465, partial [Planctomycetota bacterium]|nr:hypothetical protein [Planctomycetota bacterium]
MIGKRAFLLLALAAAAAALWLAPREMIWSWRLALYDLWPRSSSSAVAVSGAAPLEEVISDLRLRLWQKDAEIASLRARLRHIGELREAAPQLRFISATVIGVGGARRGEEVILDRGSHDGVTVGDAVVQGQTMAGVVRRVSLHSSEAALIWSPYFLVAARVVADSPSSGAGELWAVQG